MRAAVIGLGKIGLPLAVQITENGIEVMGCDINPDVVDAVSTGSPHFPGEPQLADRLRIAVSSGRLIATESVARAVEESDVIVVVVPLLVDASGNPEYSGIDKATEEIGNSLQRGQVVIYETTLPIGATRGRFGPILERVSGHVAGTDFLLAFSPERVSSGTVFRDLRRYPKLVGGINSDSARAAIAFYDQALTFDERPDLSRSNGVWDMGSAEAAEFVKLAETTYRDVNIALANEFAVHAEQLGLDVHSLIVAANSQPYSHIHSPGVSVGGHCIPVYPRFYLAGDPEARLPAIGRETNRLQPKRAIERLALLAGGLSGMRVAVLGLSYRGGVKESAYSGAFDLVACIEALGGSAEVHDPMYSDEELKEFGFTPYRIGERIDAAVIQADHKEYESLHPDDLPGCQAMLDGRGVLNRKAWSGVGVSFATLGVG